MPAMNPFDALTFNPIGEHTSNNSLATDVTLTPPEGATKLLVSCDTKNVRFTLKGTTPTTTLGFLITAGNEEKIIPLGDDTVIKVIQVEATAVLQYQWGN